MEDGKEAVAGMVEVESPEVNIAEKETKTKEEEAMAAEKSGLGPTWLKKTEKGQRIQFVLDQGSVRTIVPTEVARGMDIKKGKGYGGFRAANG